MKKKNLTEFILDFLQAGAESGADLIQTMLTSYPESYRRARRGMLGEPPPQFKRRWADIYARKKSFYSLLWSLKRDGLIEKEKRGGASFWAITKKGQTRINKLKLKTRNLPWVAEQKKIANLIIISYDIPEKFRQQRSWLRGLLNLLDYKMVHKSVWVGKTVVSRAFIKELANREIIDYLQIFEVTKQGSLTKLI